MSYSFHLNNAPKLKFSELVKQPGLAQLDFVEGYPKPESDYWPRGFTYVFIDKVTARALEVDYDGDHFQVRVFTASAPEDYRLAIDLACAVATLTKARITPEDSETVDLESFKTQFDDDWITQFSERSINSVLAMFGGTLDKGHQVSGVTGLMSIGPNVYEQLTAVPEQAPKAFFTRLKKLNYINDEDVYQSPLPIVHDDSGKSGIRVSNYGEGVETLICQRNTVVALATGENSSMKVALSELVNMLGEQAMWLSEELVLLPKLKGEQWQSMLKQAESIMLTDLSKYRFKLDEDPYHGQTFGDTGQLSEAEFNLLVYAPVAIFCLVAGADRKIDSKEINAFQQELVKGVKVESKTLQSVLIEVASDFNAMVNYLLNEGIDMDDLMNRIVKVLDSKLPQEEALNFKVSLLRIGTIVAEASGGVFGVFGNKVCKAEREVLGELTKLFGLVEQE